MTYPFKTVPMKHQAYAWEESKKKINYAYLMEMGTGKTKVTIDTAGYLYHQEHIDALLILGNKGSYTNWIEELQKHMADCAPYIVALWSAKMTKKERVIFEKAINYTGELVVLLMNIEALSYDRSFKVAFDFAKNHDTLCVVDESTTIKNHSAKRTKAAWKLRDVCTARRILTGSLVDNKPLDCWAQFEFLKKGILGYSSYYAFRAQYANLIELNVKQRGILRTIKTVTGYKNIADLKTNIAKFSILIKKKDCLDLPPKIYLTYKVELTQEQRYIYEEMKKKSMVELKNTMASVKNVLSKLLRLHQIVCGYLIDDDGGLVKIKNNRLEALLDICDESQGKVLIWSNYRYNIQEISLELRRQYGTKTVMEYYGDTSAEDRESVKKAALRGTETDMRWLVSNTQSGGYGNNWTAFNNVVYYANNFNGEQRNQSEDRCHRIGQTESVTYTDIVAVDTIDEKIIAVLKNKKNLSDIITQTSWENFFK